MSTSLGDWDVAISQQRHLERVTRAAIAKLADRGDAEWERNGLLQVLAHLEQEHAHMAQQRDEAAGVLRAPESAW